MIGAVHIVDLGVSRGERRLFSGLTLSIEAGQGVSLIGGNGVGKTSLIRALAGLLRPAAGEVRFTGAQGLAMEATEARSRHLHHLGHVEGLKGGRLARDELAFQIRWLGADDEGLARAAGALRLAPLLDLPVRQLSAGQRRRLALARLVAARRSLWLLDEPLAPLDASWRETAGTLMRDHLDAGGMIVAAVHDPLPIETRTLDLGRGP